jgi:hypothetical protein
MSLDQLIDLLNEIRTSNAVGSLSACVEFKNGKFVDLCDINCAGLSRDAEGKDIIKVTIDQY